MADALLVLNAGSSSLKFSLFADQSLDVRLHGEIEGIGGAAHFFARDSRETTLGEKALDRNRWVTMRRWHFCSISCPEPQPTTGLLR